MTSARRVRQSRPGLFLLALLAILGMHGATQPARAEAALALDKVVTKKQATRSTTVTTAAFSTAQADELLVAFIAADGPNAVNGQRVTGVTGGGLSWTLRQRVNTQAGTSEIWQAVAPSVLSNVTVRATLVSSHVSMLSVASFTGAATLINGGLGAANAPSGAPSVGLTATRSGSWVWGVGNDWDRAVARTVGGNQTKVSEFLASVGDTFWVQRRTTSDALAGAVTTLNDTAPTNDRWNFAAIEIPPAVVDTTAPSAPTDLVADAPAPNRVDLAWTASTDDLGVTGYRVYRDGTPVGTSSGTTHTDNSAVANTEYTYTVRALDAAGNLSGESNPVTLSTPGPDAEPPTVALTAPADGAMFTGTVTMAADAGDDTGVTGVQFLLDGSPLGSEDTAAPWTTNWDTTTATRGQHTLTARARDAAGNATTSSPVQVTVTGDFSLTIDQPTLTLPSSGEGFYEIDIAYLHTFTSSNVDLWVEGLPEAVSGRFLLDPLVHQGTTEYLVTTEGIEPGTYSFTLGATDLDGSGLTRSRQVTLVIDNAPAVGITATPGTQNVTAGGSVDYSVNATATGGFNGNLMFSAAGLPTGASAIFSPTSLTPPGSVNLRIATTGATPPGQYTVTIAASDGSVGSSTQVGVNVTASTATWNVGVLGSTGTPNNTVRVGSIRSDNLNRVYVGTIGTGRVLEYSRSGSTWAGPVDAGGSPTGAEIHDMTIGDGRGDGQDRLYAASYDHNVYEIWHDGTQWRQTTVATLDELGMHAAVGDGRGDGVQRLYLISTQSLYEYTWNGTAWVGGRIGATPGAHGIVVASPRGDGQMGLYIASISSGAFEARWNGTAWNVVSMGDSGDVRNIYVGDGRNDGVQRVYGALLDGRLREYTWTGSGWSQIHSPSAGGGLIHSYVTTGRNDGVNRVYASSTNGKTYEYTWNGSSWGAPVNMGGGSDYMYGQHFGDGRNDGIVRFYTADRGAVNRVYEYTWSGSVADSQPPTAPGNLSASVGTASVNLSWSAATDNVGVARYNVYRSPTENFTPSAANRIAQPAGTTYANTGVTAGTYHYKVAAEDGNGNVGPPSEEVVATVAGDTQSPTATLTSPQAGTTVSGTVTLSGSATDNVAVAGVSFLVDGAVVAGSDDTTAPYSFAWNSTTVANGSHTVAVRARDASGNSATSAAATVTVFNAPSTGLVASFGFNEGSGAAANDGAGTNNVGAISGGAAWTGAGRNGGALSFDGINDLVTIADANELDLTTGMTLSAWVRPSSLQSWSTVVLKEAGNTMAYSLYAADDANRPPAGYVQIAGDKAVVGSTALALNTWTHLATTFNGSLMSIYVNGALVGTRNLSGSILTSTGALRIGGNNVWGEYFHGVIDDVRIYNRAQSAPEIQNDLAAGL